MRPRTSTVGLATARWPLSRGRKDDCCKHLTPALPASEGESPVRGTSLVGCSLIPMWTKSHLLSHPEPSLSICHEPTTCWGYSSEQSSQGPAGLESIFCCSTTLERHSFQSPLTEPFWSTLTFRLTFWNLQLFTIPESLPCSLCWGSGGAIGGERLYALDNTFMTVWEYFGEAVKCNSSMLLQNCQLISEETQNTNKLALFAPSMLYCSAGFREAAASTASCNSPADSVSRWVQGSNAPWMRKKNHVAYGGESQT